MDGAGGPNLAKSNRVFLLEGLGIAVSEDRPRSDLEAFPKSLFPLLLDPLYILAAMEGATIATVQEALLPAPVRPK
jgi:hypothetical protein